MRSTLTTILLGIVLSGTLAAGCGLSHAGSDAWSVVGDPIGLKKASNKLSDSLERTLNQLNVLERQINYDATQRLDQIRSILHDVDRMTTEQMVNAEKAMISVETQVYRDAINLIYRAECAVAVAVLQFHQAFADLISNLIKADPSIKIAGIKIVDLSANKIEIQDPDTAYWDTKTARLKVLDNKITDDTDAYEIFSAYQNLERASKLARCHYVDQQLGLLFVEEANALEVLSLPWNTVVKVKPPT